MGARQVAAVVVVPLLLVAGCGSGLDSGARSSPPQNIGSVTTQPFGDAEIQQISTLSEVPAAQVDYPHGSEFSGSPVYISEDRSKLFYPQDVGFCDNQVLVLEAEGDEVRVTATASSGEPSDEVCAAGAVTLFVTVTLDEPLGDRVLIID